MSENREYPSRPIVAVGIVVLRGDEVLLVRRGNPPRQGQWSLPGGKQRLGETLEDGARREVLEETGLVLGPLTMVDVVDSITTDPEGGVRYHYSLIEWMGEYRSGELHPGDDAADARWFPMHQLEKLGLWNKTLDIIRQAKKMRDG